ncbi:MAG TPA: major capsid protein, partial [Giesbergeria sp.]|nr:major capsid protein [Giesbergeria sp.]
PHDDVVLPEEVQGIRAFGSETEMEAISGVLARHLETMRNKHAITLEHLRMGALKGEILDADGSVISNLFTEFQITPQSVNFDLANANSEVKGHCYDLLTKIEDALQGEFMTGVHVLCSPEFFRALTTHKEVKTAYTNWQQGAVLINDVRSGFTYAGVTFEEYRGQAAYLQANGDLGTRRFIAAGEAHAFPLGTVDTFGTYFAPADFNETVNTLGQSLYAKQAPRQFDRGTDLHTQSNPLPMCHRPGVLVKLTAA